MTQWAKALATNPDNLLKESTNSCKLFFNLYTTRADVSSHIHIYIQYIYKINIDVIKN